MTGPRYRSILAVGILGAALAPLAWPAVSPAQAAGKLVIKKKALKPTKLSGAGGEVFVKVQVSKKGAEILSVRGQASIPGQGAGSAITLTRSGKVYSGHVPVPGNSLLSPVSGSLNLIVSTSDGVEPMRRLATLQIAAGTDSLPPAPPR